MPETYLEAVDDPDLRIARSGTNRPWVWVAFVYPEVVDAADHRIVDKGNQGIASQEEWLVRLNTNNRFEFFYTDATTYFGIENSLTIIVNTWYMVLVDVAENGSNDNRAITVWKLGDANGTVSGPNVSVPPTNKAVPLILGAGPGATLGSRQSFGRMRIDSMGIYHGRSFSGADLAEMENGGLGRKHSDLTANLLTGLIDWWDFDEETGTVTHPSKVSNNPFTVIQGTAQRKPKRGLS